VIDVVTLWHRPSYRVLTGKLAQQLAVIDPYPHNFFAVDNSPPGSRGFAAGCNQGAAMGTAPIILFLNPDMEIHGPFLGTIAEAFADPKLVICGEAFDKPTWQWRDVWGCDDWVCGACLATRRSWFPGFDQRYRWGWEETDLIRRAQNEGFGVRSLHLPVTHTAGVGLTEGADAEFKMRGMRDGRRLFLQTWGRGRG
jgi:GT2 family glycosyltransferase